MTINDLIKQCEIRKEYLQALKHSNIQLNNQDVVNKIDAELLEIENTLTKLNSAN